MAKTTIKTTKHFTACTQMVQTYKGYTDHLIRCEYSDRFSVWLYGQ